MVMGRFPKEMLDRQLNFAICTYKKIQDSFPCMTKMAKHRSYHCTFHNLSLHILSVSLHKLVITAQIGCHCTLKLGMYKEYMN